MPAGVPYGPDLGALVTELGSAVLAVSIFTRIGFGSVQGCLAAGLVTGPCGIRVFTETARLRPDRKPAAAGAWVFRHQY